MLYIRDGTRTVTALDAHWATLLGRYRAAVIAESREGVDAFIRKVVEGLGDNVGGRQMVPLALEMDDLTFIEALTDDGQRRPRRFVRSARADIGIGNAEEAARANTLTKPAAVALQAVLADARDTFDAVIKSMHEAYEASVEGHDGDYTAPPRAAYWLEVVLRLICIGAGAVREEAWWV